MFEREKKKERQNSMGFNMQDIWETSLQDISLKKKQCQNSYFLCKNLQKIQQVF